MANNRKRGHDAERYYAKVFYDMGFTFCKTSRLASRLLDNCKVDLYGLPYNIQVKGGKHKNLNPRRVLNQMRELLALNFPPHDPVHSYPSFIIHRRMIYSNQNDDDIVYYLKDNKLIKTDFKSLKTRIENDKSQQSV